MKVRPYTLVTASALASAYSLLHLQPLFYPSLALLSYSLPFRWALPPLLLLSLAIFPADPIISVSLLLPILLNLLRRSFRLNYLYLRLVELYSRRLVGGFFYRRGEAEKAIRANLLMDVFLISLILPLINPLYGMISAIPLLALLTFLLKKEGEDELPYLSLLAWISSSAGAGGVERGLEGLEGRSTFPYLYSLRLHFFKFRTYFKLDLFESLRRLAKKCEGRFSEFLDGYHSVLLKGGDITSYLKDETRSLLEETYSRWASKVGSISTAGEMLFIALGLLPNMVALSSFMGFGFLPFDLLSALLPTLYFLSFCIADLFLPPSGLKIHDILPFVLSAPIFSSLLLAFPDPSPSLLSLFIAVSLIPPSSLYVKCWITAKLEEIGMGKLLRRAVDGLKTGSSLFEVLKASSDLRIVSKPLRKWVMDVELGKGPSEAADLLKWTSIPASRAFFLLAVALEKGAGLEAVESLLSFHKKISSYRHRLQSEAAWVFFFALFTPAISAMALGLMAEVTGFSDLLYKGAMLLLENSMLGGILAAKLSTFTVKSAPIMMAIVLSTYFSMTLFGLP